MTLTNTGMAGIFSAVPLLSFINNYTVSSNLLKILNSDTYVKYC